MTQNSEKVFPVVRTERRCAARGGAASCARLAAACGAEEKMSLGETDNQLLSRLKGGDYSALGPIYTRHCSLLRREVASCGVWSGDRDDVIQEVLLNLPRRLASWHSAKCSAIRALKSIARAVAIDWVRRRQIEIDRFGELDGEPVARAHRPDLAGEVAGLMAKLPESQRQAVELVYLEEMTHIEAAQTMGVTVEVCRQRVHRAIVFLRETAGVAQ